MGGFGRTCGNGRSAACRITMVSGLVGALSAMFLVSGVFLSSPPARPAGAGVVWAQSTRGEIEIRPAGSAPDDLKTAFSAEVLATLDTAIPKETRVERYLFVRLEDGAMVLGIDPLNASLRTLTRPFRPRWIAGRGFRTADAQQAMGLVGEVYSETHRTTRGTFWIRDMVYPGHNAPTPLGQGQVRVLGIFQSADKDGDNMIVVPLAQAQTLLQKPGQVNRIFVTTFSPEKTAILHQTLQAALGTQVVMQVRKR